MSSKIRLLTRTFDLSVEGESVEEVEELMNIMETKGLFKGRTSLSAPIDSKVTPISESAENESYVGGDASSLDGLSLTALEGPNMQGMPPTTVAPVSAGPSAISKVTKRYNDVFILSPKLPPGASGDRTDDAALILLAAYDQNKEVPVTGSRLIKSLKMTGYTLERVDKILEPQMGFILTEGVRRGRRYSLSESGRAKALKLAEELVSIVGQPSSSEVKQ